MAFWLVKTEPEVFSFDDFLSRPKRTTSWDGVRNYQARNFMRDHFKIDDKVLIYHSNTSEPAIVGIAVVAQEAYPDPSALDPKSPYFDAKSKSDGKSRWVMVDLRAVAKFRKPITLKQLRGEARLKSMALLKRGQRLSVQPVTPMEWNLIQSLSSLLSLEA